MEFRLLLFRFAGDADIFLDIVVPRHHVVIADRPIAGDALALVGFEVARAPAEAPAPPDQRFSAERARPDPAELLAVLERIGVEAVVVVELEVARREITVFGDEIVALDRSEEHTSELQSLMRISYAVFCLTKKK